MTRKKGTTINSISVEKFKTKYVAEEHSVIVIDGTPLDLLLHDKYPDNLFLGLVPTIIDWFNLKIEADFVQHCFDENRDVKVLPILMCPDDCDLSCTLIVAEVVEASNELIKWKRIGVNRSIPTETIENREINKAEVDWLDRIPEMIFYKHEYKKLQIIYKPIE